MKKVNIISIIILLVVVTGCGGGKQSTDDFITIDVTKSYPKKELILQECMDVEYIPLETNDEFVAQSEVMDIGKEFILVKNAIRRMDGEFFIFDRTGKGVSKFNRRGNGPGEYVSVSRAFLDEGNGEIFADDFQRRGVKVYDLSGKFKREFNYAEGTSYGRMLEYDGKSFMYWNDSHSASQLYKDKASKTPFFIVSKHDGSIIEEIKIPFEEIIQYTDVLINGTSIRNLDRSNVIGNTQSIVAINPVGAISIINSQGQWILAEASSDTIYSYLPDHTMIPLMARTPSIQSMNDPKIFLLPGVITDQYYFMQIFKREYDFATQRTVPEIDLMYDRQSKTFFEYTMYNDDYSDKRPVAMMKTIGSENDGIAFWQTLEAYKLVEEYKEGKLKGKLKEIAAGLDPEDNAVIMIVKHKK